MRDQILNSLSAEYYTNIQVSKMFGVTTPTIKYKVLHDEVFPAYIPSTAPITRHLFLKGEIDAYIILIYQDIEADEFEISASIPIVQKIKNKCYTVTEVAKIFTVWPHTILRWGQVDLEFPNLINSQLSFTKRLFFKRDIDAHIDKIYDDMEVERITF